MVEWQGAGERCALREERIGGVRFLAVGIRRGKGWRTAQSMRRAARTLQRNGVRQAVFPVDLAAYELFAAQGIRPVDIYPLREAAAAAIARRLMQQAEITPREATVALCAGQVTRAYAAAAEALAGEVRYLQLCTAHGGWELSQALRSRFGAAAPVLHVPERADITLCFDVDVCGAGTCGICLPLYDPDLYIDYAAAAGSPGRAAEQLLAAQYASLVLRAEEIRVRRICL